MDWLTALLADGSGSPPPGQMSGYAQQLFDATNQARVAATSPGSGASGPPLNYLSFDPALLGPANARANAQDPGLPLNHYEPDGSIAFANLLRKLNYGYGLGGENIGRANTPTSPADMVQAWMNSPTHRKNILEPAFSNAAMGQNTTGNTWAELFSGGHTP